MKEITSTIIQLADLFKKNGYYKEAAVFTNYASELELEQHHEVRRKIISMYQGMGSFNDIVLQNDGKLLIEENDELFYIKNITI